MSIERRFCVALRYTLYYGLTLVLVLSAAFVFSANAATLEYGEFIGEYRGNPGQLGNDGVEDLLVATGDSRFTDLGTAPGRQMGQRHLGERPQSVVHQLHRRRHDV